MLLAYKQLPSQSVISIWELLTYWAGVYIHEGPRLTLQLLVLHFFTCFGQLKHVIPSETGTLIVLYWLWLEWKRFKLFHILRNWNGTVWSGSVIKWVTYTYIPETSFLPSFLPIDNIETWNGNTYVQSCKMQLCCQKWSVMQPLVPVTKWK